MKFLGHQEQQLGMTALPLGSSGQALLQSVPAQRTALVTPRPTTSHPPKLHWENCADERLRFLARRGVTLAPAINLRAKAMITSVQKPFFPVGLQRKKNDQQED